jgi:heme A synthase
VTKFDRAFDVVWRWVHRLVIVAAILVVLWLTFLFIFFRGLG